MEKIKLVFLSLAMIVFTACSNSNSDSPLLGSPPESENPNNSGNSVFTEWLIPRSDVKDGGPGKDGIPAIDHPIFVEVDSPEADFLTDNELVVGIVFGDEARAYPHQILDWHEIVNDRFNDAYITISYCPLTGTAFAWESYAGSELTTFGVSGLLYNANLILYDRKTDSHWSQMGLKCVNGKQIGEVPKTVKIVETTWFQWKLLYPNTTVLSTGTGFSRSYGSYPYGPYKTDHDYFIFEANPKNDALPNKERVYAILDNEQAVVFQFEKFTGGNAAMTVFNGKNYLIVGNDQVICAFELEDPLTKLTYTTNNSMEELGFFSDDEGNQWSIFGEAIEGPRQGTVMKPATSVVSYWFAVAAFYPNPRIYQ